MTATRKRHDEDDDPFDERGVLKDRRSYHVPMRFADAGSPSSPNAIRMYDHPPDRDSARPKLHDSRAQFHDGGGGPIGNRPTFIVPSQPIPNDRREELYRLHDEEESNRWRTPLTRDAGGEFRGAQEGDVCTVRQGGRDEGAAGHLRRIDGVLVCVPDSPRQDRAPTFDAREAASRKAIAYRMADWESENSWRGPEWLAAHRPIFD